MAHGPGDRGARYLLPELTDRGLLDSFTGLTYRGFTGYVLTGGSMAMDAAIDLISQSCLNPTMDSAAIAVERGRLAGEQWHAGVVEDEVELRRSWLREAVSAATSAVHQADALGHDPAGRPDLLRSLTDDDIRSFHRRWYTAESMIICRAAEGEPFDLIAGAERPGWSWQPRVRHAAVPVERGQDSGLGDASPAEYALCWRAGAFAPSQRESNLLTARCIGAALGRKELRQRLAEAGWVIVAGPIVDSTLPDPCVIAVLRESAPGAAGSASDTVNGLLRIVASDQAGLAGLRKLAGNLTEPVVPEPWAARAVLALAAGLAGGPPREEPSGEELGSAILECACDGSAQPGGPDGQFAVRTTPAGARAELPPVPSGPSAPTAAAREPEVSSSRTPEQSGAGRVELVVGADSRRWPGHRTLASIRFYPAVSQAAYGWLAALAGLWPAGAAVPAPRLHVAGTGDGQRPFAEWSLPAGEGQLGAALTRLAITLESIGERPAAGRRPSAPDPFLVAASLSGSAQARAVLAMGGYAIAGQAPVPCGATQATGDLISVGVTGAGLATADDLRPVAADAGRRVHAALARVAAGAGAAGAGAAGQPPTPIQVRRDECGHWWLTTAGQPPQAPALTIHAIQPHWAGADSPSRGELMPCVRRVMRDSGCYAVEGRVIEDWQLTAFTVYRPRLDKLAGARLADAIVAAAASLSASPEHGRPIASSRRPPRRCRVLRRRPPLRLCSGT